MKLKNLKIYRWWKGGLWVLVTDQPQWLKAQWSERGGYIYDERGHGYHRTHMAVIAVEDYTR